MFSPKEAPHGSFDVQRAITKSIMRYYDSDSDTVWFPDEGTGNLCRVDTRDRKHASPRGNRWRIHHVFPLCVV